jgi:hypothetical protein
MRLGLSLQQQAVVNQLQTIKGGVLLVQGPSSTSKTKILIVLYRLQYCMRCLYSDNSKDKAISVL